jgi:hypothetical protein
MTEGVNVEIVDLDGDPFFRVHRAIHNVGLKPTTAWLYCCLKDFGNRSGKCWAEEATVLARAGISRAAYFTAMKELEAVNMVKRTSAPGKRGAIFLLKPKEWVFKLGGGGEPVQNKMTENESSPPPGLTCPNPGLAPIPLEKENNRREILKNADGKAASASKANPRLALEVQKPKTARNQTAALEAESQKPRGSAEGGQRSNPPALKPSPDRDREKGKLSAGAPPPANPVTQVWEMYSNAVHRRYGMAPKRSARVNAQLKGLIADYGLETALLMPAWFLGDNDKWLSNKCHPIGMMIVNAHKYSIEMHQGQRLTKARAERIERASDVEDVFEEIDHARANGTSISEILDAIDNEASMLTEQRDSTLQIDSREVATNGY